MLAIAAMSKLEEVLAKSSCARMFGPSGTSVFVSTSVFVCLRGLSETLSPVVVESVQN